MGTLIYGFGRYFLFGLDVVYMPEGARGMLWLGQGRLLGVPVPIFLFVTVCLLGHLFLRHTRSGRYLRAVGDNDAARTADQHALAQTRNPAQQTLLRHRLDQPLT